MKIIPRIYDPLLKRSLAGPLITVLLGPRQTGKTTPVNNFLQSVPPDRKFYLKTSLSAISSNGGPPWKSRPPFIFGIKVPSLK
jgi:predicted AAA+ superfamily ATPase